MKEMPLVTRKAIGYCLRLHLTINAEEEANLLSKFSRMGTTGLVVTTPLMAESCLSKAEEETINFIA
jgi:hypothetical protein